MTKEILNKKSLQEFRENKRISAVGYAVFTKDSKFQKYEFSRHPIGQKDILVDILYAGICHSDIHSARSEWSSGIYPMVPGHEILGQVIAKGKDAHKFEVGDFVGIGCMVNSCGTCNPCIESMEQYCESGTVYTYNSRDYKNDNEPTFGGYSNNIVLNEDFALFIDKNAPMEKIAPLLCAGITTYSPLKFSNIKRGDKLGVAGFGGLGLMAIKYGLEMGAEVSVFARNDKKRDFAKSLGVELFTSPSESKRNYFDLIISTIPTKYNAKEYLQLLKPKGEMAIVGIPPSEVMPTIRLDSLIQYPQRKIYGSLIGGIKETKEMLEFSIKHNIYPEIELISIKDIDKAYENLTSGAGNFRYVIDMKSLE